MLRSFRRVIVLSAVAATPLGAQADAVPDSSVSPAADTLAAAPGDRIRLAARTLLNPRVVGRIAWLSDDSLALAYRADAGPLVLARRDLTRLEVSRGRPALRSRATLGATVGAVAGGLLGLALAERVADCVDCAPDMVRARLGLGGGGAGLGALVGAMLGTIGVREAWAPARLESSPSRSSPTRPTSPR